MSQFQQLQDRLQEIQYQIDHTLQQSGRTQQELALCIASKTQSVETIAYTAKLNIACFGENRVQELLHNYQKNAYLTKPIDFIGQLQSNKVKQIVGKVRMIQSVDSVKLLHCIEKEAIKQGICQDILLEVNIGQESSKGGVSPAELESLLHQVETCQNIRVKGLMTIPPKSDNERQTRNYFAQMYTLFCNLKQRSFENVEMDILSMGMSQDFSWAILEGSTMVRIGTALFGKRTQ